LTNNPNKKLHILGHTDSTGDDEVNIWVSQQRANTLKKYFIDLGIDENQIIAIAKGETEPLDTNSSIEGRRKNRRIELIIK
jgi:outer membrane protein OmpA-like peptidoglycan-associated protein